MPEEKIYLGKGKYITTKYGEMFTGYLTKDSVMNLQYEKFIPIQIVKMKEKDKNDNTHTIVLNTYKKPDEQKTETRPPDTNFDNNEPDLPF